ncbi:conjugal transfer protein [Bartonella henselae]|uniref:TrwL4 protein n=1 Tax=Bartonella henselae TaxID=38323 RepID=B0RK69_BARHN|nr:VirB2 family type IV secretion system major pilin TrwL7 [Bartonella henselae]MDM9997046.1 VirB2 family type IV secretion system major pilin TrwL7 [Bartonella henselae]OLL49101.1 conjugal transfer protein [Bartonella henselae]OLL51218.1 conjugal transfer protein [Bartonella henselae]OLL51905.1 conjugal transfer protein [Bartonella henselae]OLL57044.1 conjugal transfer protein [Bartonella henselae]
MKQLNNLKSKINNKIIAIAAVMTVFFRGSPVYAQKLDNAKSALSNLQTELTGKIIPVAAAVILLCLAIGYAGRYIEKDTFIRWAIGVVIAGSASELVTLLFTTQ